MNSNGIGRGAMRFGFAFGLWAAAPGFALAGCTSGHGLVAGLGKADAGTGAPGGGSSGTGESTAAAASTGSLADAGVAGSSGGDGGVGSGRQGGGGAAGSAAGGASSGGSVAASRSAPDAGFGAVDARPRDFTRLIGKYKVTALTGGLSCDGTGSSIQFKDEPMTVERGADANLIATTNPMPGEYPAPCALKIDAMDHPESGMLLAPRDTICTSGGVTLALTAYIFANNVSDTKIGITATGTVTGGPNGKCDFGYGAEAAPVP